MAEKNNIPVDHSPAGYGLAYMKQNFPDTASVIITYNPSTKEFNITTNVMDEGATIWLLNQALKTALTKQITTESDPDI